MLNLFFVLCGITLTIFEMHALKTRASLSYKHTQTSRQLDKWPIRLLLFENQKSVSKKWIEACYEP